MKRITDVSPEECDRIAGVIVELINIAREHVTAEASWQSLETYFYEQMLRSTTLTTRQVVALAEAGHPAADRAVRRYFAEMMDRGREGELLVQVKAYAIKTMLEPFVPYPRGRHVVQNFLRDLWLPALVDRVAETLNVPATRSATTTAPSAAFFLALAFKKRAIKLTEREINRVYWNRNKLPTRIEASMPLIPSSTIKEKI